MAIVQMCEYTRSKGIEVVLRPYGNALIHRSRNAALAGMSPNSTHALLLDDDMLPREHALVDLLACDIPVVSGLCSTRTHPAKIAAKVYDEDSDQFLEMATIKMGHLVTGPFAVGAAFLLLRRDVIEQSIEYYLSGDDWLAERRRELDRLKVRSELREKEKARISELRRAMWDREKQVRIFDYPVIENTLQLGEDVSFSRKLLQMKIPVSIDTKTIVGHIGEHPYSIWDVIHGESK